MTVLPAVKSIEQLIEKNRAKNTYLEPQLALQCVSDLKQHILQDQQDGQSQRAGAVITLQIVLHLSKSDDKLISTFDETLFGVLFGVLSQSTPADLVIAVLRIMLIYTSGSLFEHVPKNTYLVPFLDALHANLSVLDVLATKLYLENVDLTIKITAFINAFISIDHLGMKSVNNLIKFLLVLGKTDFYLLINNYNNDARFDAGIHKAVSRLSASSSTMYQNLNKVDLSESTFDDDLITNVCTELSRTSKKEEKNYITSNYTALQLMDLFVFFESPNITFKKSYHQQLLFTLKPEKIYPLTEVSATITDRLLLVYTDEVLLFPNLSKNIFLRDFLHHAMMLKFLDVWTESEAEIEDLENLLPLLSIILHYLDDSIDPEGELDIVEKLNDAFELLTYHQLREIQLNNFKKYVEYATRDEMTPFDNILKAQVFEFVKNQRFLKLAKGSWVYAESPSVKNSAETSSSYYFIILSPNFTQLLYKQFPNIQESTPNIDRSGHAIPISSIVNFKIEEIPYSDQDGQSSVPNSKLINLVDKTVINKITLLNRKHKQLFVFYAKKTDSLAWVDGLNLLLGNFDRLSLELSSQISKLFEIRKTVQLLNFNDQTTKNTPRDDTNLSLEFLEALSSNFHYT